MQTPDEIRAHFQGPVAVVFAWLAALRGDNWDDAWRLSDGTFRLVRAQWWLWNNRNFPGIAGHDLDQLAAELSKSDPEHELWSDFARLELAAYKEAWAGWDLGNLGAGSRPRPVDLDYEVVVLTPAGPEPILFTEATPIEALLFLTHLVDDRWLVANAGSDQRPQPGWPPVS